MPGFFQFIAQFFSGIYHHCIFGNRAYEVNDIELLIAELPELKRVIVSTGGRVAWAENFGGALSKLMNRKINLKDEATKPAAAAPSAPQSAAPSAAPADITSLINEAQRLYDASQSAQRGGDWAGYGENIRRLGEVLERMRGLGL